MKRIGASLLGALALVIASPLVAQTPGGGGATDPAPARELAELKRENAVMIGRLIGDEKAAATVRITFMGKGRTQAPDFSEPDDDRPTTAVKPLAGFVAFNPQSGNEYRIEIPPALLRRIGDAAARAGLTKPGTAEPAGPERPDAVTTQPRVTRRGGASPLLRSVSWSGGVDNRQRLSSLTKGTDRWVWRAIADLGGCTATMVGPRHAITAGHCIYNRKNAAWNAGFKVTPGRAGANFNYGQVTVPSAPFTWYFTPVGFRDAAPSGGTGQFDIGILVLSERIGEKTSWMGWWYGTDSYLQSTAVYNRGFPLCAGTENGVARTDDPGDTGSSVVCVASHLYGDPSTCTITGFTASDGMGWTRRFKHSCDASAGQSGSPLYLFRDNTPYVTAVHTTSTCGKTASAAKCTATDTTPLAATRVTREYSDWLAYFRAWKP